MTINILSICWDYFTDVDGEIRYFNFPDGGNEQLNPQILNFIWSSCYANYYYNTGNALSDKAVLKNKDYNALVNYLKINSTYLRAYYAYSHGALPQLLESMFDRNVKLNIYNVDFHHDTYGAVKNKRQIDCGNWLSYLIDVKKVKAFWVKDKDSSVVTMNKKIKIITFDELLKVDDFAMVFLCRSDAWSPPHLDPHYVYLLNLIKADNVQKYDTKFNRFELVAPLIDQNLQVYKNMMTNLNKEEE